MRACQAPLIRADWYLSIGLAVTIVDGRFEEVTLALGY
jgi:hypothetical protein